jgi:hypothetical protein
LLIQRVCLSWVSVNFRAGNDEGTGLQSLIVHSDLQPNADKAFSAWQPGQRTV